MSKATARAIEVIQAACDEDRSRIEPMTEQERSTFDEIVRKNAQARKEGRVLQWDIPYDYE